MAHHRNPDDEITFFQRLFTNPPAFTANDQGSVHIGGKFTEVHLPYTITAGNPESPFLQCIYRMVDIRHSDYGHEFNCSGRSLGNGVCELYRAAVLNDHTIKTGRVTRSEYRLQVMRILSPVKDDLVCPPAFHNVEKRFRRHVFLRT